MSHMPSPLPSNRLLTTTLSFLLFAHQSLKSPIAEQTAANKAALIETTKKVATFDGSKIFLRPEYAATPPA